MGRKTSTNDDEIEPTLHIDEPAIDDDAIDGTIRLDAIDDALEQADDESDERSASSRLSRARRYAPSLVGTLYVAAVAGFLWNLTTILSSTYTQSPLVVLVAAFLLSLGAAIDYYRTRVRGKR